MKKKLTDKDVALALGWESQTGIRIVPKGTWTYWYRPGDDKEYDANNSLWPFTTSLDAIVREIKRLKIELKVRVELEFPSSGKKQSPFNPMAVCKAVLVVVRRGK